MSIAVAAPMRRLRQVLAQVAASATADTSDACSQGVAGTPPAWTIGYDDLPSGIRDGLQLYSDMFGKLDGTLLPKLFHPKGHMVGYDNNKITEYDYAGLEKLLSAGSSNQSAVVSFEFIAYYFVGKDIVATLVHDCFAGKVNFHTNLVWVDTSQGWRILSKSYTRLAKGVIAKPSDTWTRNNEGLPQGISDSLQAYMDMFSNMDLSLLPKVYHPKGHMAWYDDETKMDTLKALDEAGLQKMLKRFAGKNPQGKLGGHFVGHFNISQDLIVTMLHDHADNVKWHTNLVWINMPDGWRILSKAYTTIS